MKRNWLCSFVLAMCAYAVLSSGGCGGSSSSSTSDSQDVTPTPQSQDVTPTPQSQDVPPVPEVQPVVSGTFRISTGMYNNGQGTITGSAPSEFTFALTKNADSDTFTVTLGEAVQCTVSLTGGGTTNVPLDIEGSDYVYAPEDGEDYYVSGRGEHDDEHSSGEVWKEIGIDENGKPDFKREVYGENGWVTVLEGQLDPVN